MCIHTHKEPVYVNMYIYTLGADGCGPRALPHLQAANVCIYTREIGSNRYAHEYKH